MAIKYSKQDLKTLRRFSRELGVHEADIVRALEKALRSINVDFKRIASLIAQGQIGQAVDLIDWNLFERELSVTMSAELRAAMVRGANTARDIAPGALAAGFFVLSPHVENFIRGHTAELVREITASQKMAVRRYVYESYIEGRPPGHTARRLRGIIGLTEKQALAVSRFEAHVDRVLLGELSEDSLRSRFRLAPKIGQRKAEQLKQEYAYRMLRHRHETIAIHEANLMYNAGNRAMYEQAMAQGHIPPNAVYEWLTTPDERACTICIPMHGVQVPAFGGMFQLPNGDVKAGPPAHIRCRCGMILVTDPAAIREQSEGEVRANTFLSRRLEELVASGKIPQATLP